jgi:Flp pilus assembly protein protease CpaA
VILILKTAVFAAVLLYASAVDIRTRTVPWHVLGLLFGCGLIGAGTYSLAGAALAFLPLFITALLSPGLGGGDVKLGALCGFVMGPPVLFGLVGGMAGFLMFLPLYCRARQLPMKGTSLPLVPFIAAGCLVVQVVGCL